MVKLLTLVIPVYNMHDYLRRCLDSICVEAVMDRVQVIVVNDGSTDDSSVIAHEYEQHYPRYIQVIDKENGNYGSCMNVSLPLAEGKYFRTLDADDWFDSLCYSQFVERLLHIDADMILSEKIDHYGKQKRIEKKCFDSSIPLGQTLPVSDIDWQNSSLREMMGVMFLTYRTSLLHDLNLRWAEGVLFSDFQYCIQPLQAVSTVCFLPYSVYQYQLEREGQSISIPWSSTIRHSFASVAEPIVYDYIRWIENVSESVRTLADLKMSLMLSNLYRTLYLDGPCQDDQFHRIEEVVKSNERLRLLTNHFDEYRGFHYVKVYRKNKFYLWLIHCDYQFRSSQLIKKIRKWLR